MKFFVKKSVDLGNGERLLAYYTPGEDLVINILKFCGFLFVIWPVQIIFWACFFILKYTFLLIWWIISLPFRLLRFIFRKIFKHDDDEPDD